jgi:hypothetical protein
MLQKCHKNVTKVLIECYKSVAKVSRVCYKWSDRLPFLGSRRVHHDNWDVGSRCVAVDHRLHFEDTAAIRNL